MDASTIPDDLVRDLAGNNVVLFVGAGLSIGAGLPGWEDLIRPLAERIGYRGDDMLKAAQYYKNRKGARALLAYLRDQLDTTHISPTANHQYLTRLPIHTVLTTNLDDLLERAYRDAGQRVNLVVEAADLPFWDASQVNLVKLHGDIDRPDTVVIAERDYHTIYRQSPRLVQQLSAQLAIKTFLLIGYKVNDPDFNQVYDLLQLDLGDLQRRPYLVTFDLTEWAIEDLEQRGFHVIIPPGADDRNARLGRWLQALVDAVEGTLPSEDAPPEPTPPTEDTPSEPTPPPPPPGLDYERGLDALRARLAHSDRYLDFATLETRLRDNLRDEVRYGTSETTRQERARIVDSLNRLALEALGVSFTDLALGRGPTSG